MELLKGLGCYQILLQEAPLYFGRLFLYARKKQGLSFLQNMQ